MKPDFLVASKRCLAYRTLSADISLMPNTDRGDVQRTGKFPGD